MLAGLLKAPSRYNPARHAGRAEARTELVLAAMVEDGAISAEDARQARSVKGRSRAVPSGQARYFADWVLSQVGDYIGQIAASLGVGVPGVGQGSMSLLLQDENGQVSPVHSISAGLDYPGVGPQLSHLKESGRMDVAQVTDEQAVAALQHLCRLEGILPALESAHALAHLETLAEDPAARVVVMNLSGRGDKDLPTLQEEVTP